MAYIPDGSDITQGKKADTAYAGSGGTTTIGGLKGVYTAVAALLAQLVSSGTITDRSGTITSGGTAQQAAAANASRRYLFIQNPGAPGQFDTAPAVPLWVNFGVTAVAAQPSIRINAGQTLVFDGRFVPVGTVSVIAATTSTPFVIKEG
jgi:hypothetical protein